VLALAVHDACPGSLDTPPDAAVFFAARHSCNASAANLVHLPTAAPWARSRNALYERVQEAEKARGCQFLYHVYMDAGALLSSAVASTSAMSAFADFLVTELPLIGYPAPLHAAAMTAVWTTHFESHVVALSPRARQYLLPLDELPVPRGMNADMHRHLVHTTLLVQSFFSFFRAAVRCASVRVAPPGDSAFKQSPQYVTVYAQARERGMANVEKLMGQRCPAMAQRSGDPTYPFLDRQPFVFQTTLQIAAAESHIGWGAPQLPSGAVNRTPDALWPSEAVFPFLSPCLAVGTADVVAALEPPRLDDARVIDRLAPYPVSLLRMPAHDVNGRNETRDFYLPLCNDVFVAYATQGPRCPEENTTRIVAHHPLFRTFFLSWDSPCESEALLVNVTYVHKPKCSWASGRNALGALIHSVERGRGCQFLYWILADDDAILTRDALKPHRAQNLTDFITFAHWLFTEMPVMAFLDIQSLRIARLKSVSRGHVVAVDCYDGFFNAFSPRSRQFSLPYDETFDGHSWWTAQIVQYLTMAHVLPGTSVIYPHAVGTNMMQWRNESMATYKRGKNMAPALPRAVANIRAMFGMQCTLRPTRDPLRGPDMSRSIRVPVPVRGGAGVRMEAVSEYAWAFNGVELFHTPGRFTPFHSETFANCTRARM